VTGHLPGNTLAWCRWKRPDDCACWLPLWLPVYKRLRKVRTVLIISVVLIDVVRSLREAGVSVRQPSMRQGANAGADVILDVELNGVRARFAAEVKSRAPYPGELRGMASRQRSLSTNGVPLLVVPFVSAPRGAAMTKAGWSWGDEHGNFDLRAAGLVMRQRTASSPPAPKRRTLPRGSGSYAAIRALISLREKDNMGVGATALANQANVSQPRASQILGQLDGLGLVERLGRGRWLPRRDELLDRFLAEYPGPGGSEQYFYTLDPLAELAAHLTQTPARQDALAVSADVGPDLIQPWRRPSTLIVYTKAALASAALRVTEAVGTSDANVIVRSPADHSVFPPQDLAAEFKGARIPLADPVQMIWDLQDLGGADRDEAAGKLSQWLLHR
jgi:hypothetical protein